MSEWNTPNTRVIGVCAGFQWAFVHGDPCDAPVLDADAYRLVPTLRPSVEAELTRPRRSAAVTRPPPGP